jgi:hypothetical protein
MKVEELLYDEVCEFEEVYVDENDEVLSEAAKRQWKRQGAKLVKKYRCLSGPKKNRLVSKPGDCATRKDPKKVRKGRRIMRMKKGTIRRKSKISKRKSISKILQKLNARLMGKTPRK